MITVIEGKAGSGKDLLLAMLSKKSLDDGKKVYLYSDMGLKFNFDYIPFKNDLTGELYYYAMDGKLSNAAVALDEPYSIIDCRNSSSKVNKLFSYLAMQARMRNIDFFITVSDFETIDKRIRKMCDYLLSTKYFKKSKKLQVTFKDIRSGETIVKDVDVKDKFSLYGGQAPIEEEIFEKPKVFEAIGIK